MPPNYCTKCAVWFTTPRTCNCYGEAAPVTTPPWTVTWRGPCGICGQYNCTQTHITVGSVGVGSTSSLRGTVAGVTTTLPPSTTK
jgi:hypothetical protein